MRDLLFVHGMWSTSSVWDAWRAPFESRGYRCRALCLPGHLPEVQEQELTQVDFAACFRAALTEMAVLDRPVVVGHSFGGLIAQQLAARSEPSAVVLLNSAAPRAVLPMRPRVLPGLARHLHFRAFRGVIRLSRREANYLLYGGLAPAQRERMFAQALPESGRLFYEVAFGPLGPWRAHHVDPRAIRCPMLALSGSDDRIIPRGVSRAMAAYYGAKLTYRELPGRAHWLLGEPGFEQRITDILDWLAQVGVPGAALA